MILEQRISKTRYIALAGGGLVISLLIWELLAFTGIIKPFFLLPPEKVFLALVSLAINGELLSDIAVSVYRILLGSLLSLAIALPVGIALGTSKRFEAFTEPLIAFVRYVPPSAFIPLAIIWFGIGELEKIAILFLGIAPYLALLIADTVLNTRREFIEAALTLGAKTRDIILKIILPHSLPGIWDSFRIMFGAAWTFVIIAEIVGASSGLGHLMIESQRFLRTDNIFAGLVVIGFLGLGTDYLFKIGYQKFFPWTEKATER